MNRAYLLIGGNLGEKWKNLERTRELLREKAGNLLQVSSIYETAPWGNPDQPNFYNQAIALHTSLSPEELLAVCREIEDLMGRQREELYGARTMDIDLLLYEQKIIQAENLQIPHPRMKDRRFVLVPLQEIAAQVKHPETNQTVEELLAICPDSLRVTKIAEEKMVKTSEFSYKERILSKYQFITIEGNIGAGKTTLAHLLSKKLDARLVLEEFADNPFLPKFYENPQQYAFPLELFFMAERYKQLKEMLHTKELFSAVTLSDYLFTKCLLFARVNLPEEEYRLYQKLFDIIHQQMVQPDILIYLHAPVRKLQENIKKRNRSYEQQIPDEYLFNLQETYTHYIKQHNIKTIFIDCSNADFLSNEKHVEVVLDALSRDLGAGQHYFTLPSK